MSYSYDLTNSITQVENRIAALTGAEDIDELRLLVLATQGLAVSNFNVLAGHIQTLANGQDGNTDLIDLALAVVAMQPTTLLQRTTQTETLSASNTLTVPNNCYKAKVSCVAEGGAGANGTYLFDGNSYRRGGGGGGGAAAVVEYEIALNPQDSLVVTIGHDILVGDLTIQGGGNANQSTDAAASSNFEVNHHTGGEKGIVTYAGMPVPESANVIYGEDGQDGNLQYATDHAGVVVGNGGASHFASGGLAGVNGVSNGQAEDGQFGSGGGGGYSYQNATNKGDGGARSDVVITFIIETVV